MYLASLNKGILYVSFDFFNQINFILFLPWLEYNIEKVNRRSDRNVLDPPRYLIVRQHNE